MLAPRLLKQIVRILESAMQRLQQPLGFRHFGDIRKRIVAKFFNRFRNPPPRDTGLGFVKLLKRTDEVVDFG
jgi:hypothetical protein